MSKKNFKLLLLLLLLFIINGFIYFLYKSFDFRFILLIIFPNIALFYGYYFDSKFIKNDYINRILGYLIINIFLILSTIISIVSCLLVIKNLLMLILQCIIVVIALILYVALYSSAKNSKKMIIENKSNSLNYKAWEIDIFSLSGKYKSTDILINKIVDLIKYSPKNSNDSTIIFDKKIKVAIDALLTEEVSEEDMIEVLDYIIKLINQKNQILNLTN